MTGAQISDWFGYYSVEPFGFARDDLNFARLMSMVAAFGGDGDAGPDKFMLGPKLDEAAGAHGSDELNPDAVLASLLRPPEVDARGTPMPEHLREALNPGRGPPDDVG